MQADAQTSTTAPHGTIVTTATTTATTTASTTASTTIDELVRTHLPLVGHAVRELMHRIPAHVNRDDLVSAGMYALVLTAKSFDPERGVPFARFAAIRIKGALTDELRTMDWASRAVRGKARELDAVRTQLTTSLRRTPTRDEVATALGCSTRDLDNVDSDVQRAAPDRGRRQPHRHQRVTAQRRGRRTAGADGQPQERAPARRLRAAQRRTREGRALRRRLAG